MTAVEILSIGDELLRGIVQETNSYWLTKRIVARGAVVSRATLLPDDVDVVAAEVRAALQRAPAMLVTHGGLGPTDDDRTRQMIARALDVGVEPHDEALRIVERRYAELHASGAVPDASLTEPRRRMAILPAGARAFDNHVGTAPAFSVRAGVTTIVSLPGVPPELYWIWEHSLAPLLDEVLGPGGFAEVTFELDLLDESRIAALLEAVQARHAGVYVKSRARGFTEGEEVRLTLAATAENDADARARVDAATDDVRAELARAGVRIRDG